MLWSEKKVSRWERVLGLGWHRPFKFDARSRSLSEEVVFEKYLEKFRQGATWKLG